MTYGKWVFAVALGLCFVLMVAGYMYERISKARDARRHPSPGQMVAVGDHRLHLLCKGTLGPTVIIEQGAGEPAMFWWPVQEKVSAFARVCTYDRAGYGWSDPVRASRTIAERAEELHTLLVGRKKVSGTETVSPLHVIWWTRQAMTPPVD
jgi:pimeloyl-ACP methyl ester carboxylesterase